MLSLLTLIGRLIWKCREPPQSLCMYIGDHSQSRWAKVMQETTRYYLGLCDAYERLKLPEIIMSFRNHRD